MKETRKKRRGKPKKERRIVIGRNSETWNEKKKKEKYQKENRRRKFAGYIWRGFRISERLEGEEMHVGLEDEKMKTKKRKKKKEATFVRCAPNTHVQQKIWYKIGSSKRRKKRKY
jgi:hypothetical protein